MIEIVKAEERGVTKTAWLESYHSFSFGNYYNPKRMHFGMLRVVNDDTVQSGQGFGTHEHDNMEIVTIVLDGALKHKDNAGNEGVIYPGQVQRMTAGSGIAHSEFNDSNTKNVHFLQIWVFPSERDLKPGYEQKTFQPSDFQNQFGLVVGETPGEKNLTLHQDARFYLGYFEKGKELTYKIRSQKYGAFLFVINGQVNLGEHKLSRGDSAQITREEKFTFKVEETTTLLLIEVILNALPL